MESFSLTESGSRDKVLGRLRDKVEAHRGVARRAVEALVGAVEEEVPDEAVHVSISVHIQVNYLCPTQPREVGP